MYITVLAGAIMAISFSAPPGPVTVETIRRGLRGGFRPALHVQLGSIIGDVAWCAVALFGLAPLVQFPWLRGLLSLAGIGVLIYLGASSIRESFQVAPVQAVEPGSRGQAADHPQEADAFRTGLAISMANPMAVGYWLSVGGALVATGVAGTSVAQTSWFVAGFVGATLAWAFSMALVVRWGQRIMTPAIFRLVTFMCGSALLAFGVSLAIRMLRMSG